MTTPAEITAYALTLVGTPFHAGQRLPGVGMDCIGVAACICKHFGIEYTDRAAYSLRPTGELMPALDAQFDRVAEQQEGDVLLMSFDDKPRRITSKPHHVAILIGGNRIVHAYSTVGKCVVQDYIDFWRAKVRATYRFPGVA